MVPFFCLSSFRVEFWPSERKANVIKIVYFKRLVFILCQISTFFPFSLDISIYVIVMGIIKCEKVFAGIFILIKNKLEKLKITTKIFRTHDTHFNNIYSIIQFYSNYLKAGR